VPRVMIRAVGPAPWTAERLEPFVEMVLSELAPPLKRQLVLVKPNLVVAAAGDSGVVTHPALIAAVVRALRRRGARPVVGDNPGGIEGNSLYVARVTGALEAADGAFTAFADRVVQVQACSAYTPTLTLPRLLFESDYVINLPIFKTHLLTTLTAAVKNCFGYVAGAHKAQLHLMAPSRRRFSELLLDIYAQRPPDLHILDALTVMDGDGPTHGRVRPWGHLLASTDGLALDATAARLAGLEPASVPTLKAAIARGVESFASIDLDGELDPLPDFQLPSIFAASPQEQRRLLAELGHLRPVLQEELCLRCGECARNCPAQAISLEPYPLVGDTCISCFCCAELCPAGAMQAPMGKARETFDRMF